jgi:hypothetical protein
MAVITLSKRDTLFLSHVDVDEPGCWIWTGATNRNGYGVFGVEGRRTMLAHRYWWERTNGWLPPILDHFVCDTPLCVNSDHLRPATAQENVLRGLRRRTHCPRGHPFNEANTMIRTNRLGNPSRECAECNRQRARDRRAQSKET